MDKMLDALLHLFGYYISQGPDLDYVLVERRKVLAFSWLCTVCLSVLEKLILCGILNSA